MNLIIVRYKQIIDYPIFSLIYKNRVEFFNHIVMGKRTVI